MCIRDRRYTRQTVDRDATDQPKEQLRDDGQDEHRAHSQGRAGLLQYPPGQDDLIDVIAYAAERLPGQEEGERANG